MGEIVCWIISGILGASLLFATVALIRAEILERRDIRRQQDAWADIYERSLERQRPRDYSRPPTGADPALENELPETKG